MNGIQYCSALCSYERTLQQCRCRYGYAQYGRLFFAAPYKTDIGAGAAAPSLAAAVALEHLYRILLGADPFDEAQRVYHHQYIAVVLHIAQVAVLGAVFEGQKAVDGDFEKISPIIFALLLAVIAVEVGQFCRGKFSPQSRQGCNNARTAEYRRIGREVLYRNKIKLAQARSLRGFATQQSRDLFVLVEHFVGLGFCGLGM